MLPTAASFEDAKPKIIEIEDSADVIGKIQYSYADQVVGETAIEVMGTRVPEFDFQETKDGEILGEDEEGEKEGDDSTGESGKETENAEAEEGGEAGENEAQSPDGESGAGWLDKEIFGFKVKYILIGGVSAILLVCLGFGIYYVVDNFYLFRYKRSVRKQQKSALKDLKFKRQRRRKP